MRYLRSVIVTLCLAVLVVPAATHASAVYRSGSDISVSKDQTVDGNYYVSAGPFGKTVMSGTVQGDMYALGGSVIVNGTIANDVGILAATAQIQGPVKQDVRVIGGDVTITDPVGGDVFVIGNSLTIPSTAHVKGDVFFFGNNLDIEGAVDGSVYGNAQKVRLNSAIGGGVDMTAATALTLGDHANIKKSVRYSSYNTILRGQGSVVGGDITKVADASLSPMQQLRDLLVPFFALIFASLTALLLFKPATERLVMEVDGGFGRSLLMGVAVAILGPIAALLLMLTTIGALVGAVLLALVIVWYLLGMALSVIVVGTFTLRLFTKDTRVNILATAIGAVVMAVLSFLPFVGAIVIVIILFVTIGALVHTMLRHVTN